MTAPVKLALAELRKAWPHTVPNAHECKPLTVVGCALHTALDLARENAALRAVADELVRHESRAKSLGDTYPDHVMRTVYLTMGEMRALARAQPSARGKP